MFFFYSTVILSLAYIFFIPISNKLKININTYNFFFLINSIYLFIFIYFHFVGLGTDTTSYFSNYQKFNSNDWIVSDNFIFGINYFLRVFFYLSFENINLLTFFPRFMCTLLLLSLIEKDINKTSKIILYILLILPSANFFSMGLNKDMMIYCTLTLFLYSLINNNKIIFFISIFLVFLVRPYVMFVILFSLPVSFIFYVFIKRSIILKNLNFKTVSISIIIIPFIVFFIYFISNNFLGSFGKYFLEGDFIRIINNLQGHYVDTPLGISQDMNLILRCLNYLLYPIIWNPMRLDIFFLILSLENTFILIALLYLMFNFSFFKIKNYNTFYAIVSFFLLFIMLSTVTSNLGIAFRQKWMIIPFILILFAKNSRLVNFNTNFTNKKIT